MEETHGAKCGGLDGTKHPHSVWKCHQALQCGHQAKISHNCILILNFKKSWNNKSNAHRWKFNFPIKNYLEFFCKCNISILYRFYTIWLLYKYITFFMLHTHTHTFCQAQYRVLQISFSLPCKSYHFLTKLDVAFCKALL